MRLNILCFLILWMGTLPLLAQSSDYQNRFSASIIAGVNMAQIDGDDAAGYTKPGLNLGARGTARLAPIWDLGVEILFSQQGSQSPSLQGAPRNFYLHLNNIEVPVLILLKDWEISTEDGKDSYHRMQFGAGLSYNRILNATVAINGQDDPAVIDNFRKDYVMIVADLTFYFTKNWGLNVRWQRAPMNIRKDTYFNPYMFSLRAIFTL
ncbi:outer membrane beta-barrel protein [Saprospira grandis]|uniref:outer membrane beta-barrel protein n=1 Tax=Saprospira grandis TaxID=1008 RepID=UPI0022DE31C8|nr:outer membrane beta-barrel protein [Saprospira grandis]WBM75502.1 porin family protein [Saprospira grandis]